MMPEIRTLDREAGPALTEILPDNSPRLKQGPTTCAAWVACVLSAQDSLSAELNARQLKEAIEAGEKTWRDWEILA